MHTRTWQEAYGHVFGDRLEELSLERRERLWRDTLDSQTGTVDVFVAERDGEIVGFVSVGASREEPGVGELYAIYVRAREWGSGAATRLLTAGTDALRAAEFTAATLWVLEDNPRARRFYEREGWQLDGASRSEEFLGVEVAEVRYRRSL